jgi:uncharacterized protein (DUF427 family)
MTTLSQSQNQSQSRTEYIPTPKWVRAYFNGRLIVDSRRSVIQRLDGRPPVCFFPKQDVAMDCMNEASVPSAAKEQGQLKKWDIQVGQRSVEGAVVAYTESKVPLKDYVTITWNSMDAWFEEDEEVFVHARDPRVRVDILNSGRHIKAIVHDETVAETRNPLLLFETGLPVRYYFPQMDVRRDLLLPSDLLTRCPYKGEAQYFSMQVGDHFAENIAWYYRYPTLESIKIASYIAFYEEKIDAIEIDGKRQEIITL